jgi:hypothetical protein
MTEQLTPQQLNEFRERIDGVVAYFETQANERIAQYQSGLITFDELGRCLTTLSEDKQCKILEIRETF